ncbi:TLR22 protein, partial [Polypterus senegalus]|nr:toll-like receptor 2 type-2 isoform X2 [Polypterus senegalus]MBN3289537.1 TLR22 protein [Polypterus senegalus]
MLHFHKQTENANVVFGLYLLLSASCVSSMRQHVVNCTKTNYPTVPCHFPSDTTVLDLSHNSIEKVFRQDFSSVTGLKQLFLPFNSISFLAIDAFQDNVDLELLDISHNCLNEISALPIGSFLAMKDLDVSNNKYTEITLGQEFKKMKNLEILKLGSPQISSLKANTFSELEGLQLKEFHLITGEINEYDGALTKISGLKKLTLELNIWEHLDLLKSLLTDVANATDALKIMNINLIKSGHYIPLGSFMEYSQMKTFVMQNISADGNYISDVILFIFSSNIEEIQIIDSHSIGTFTPKIRRFTKMNLKRIYLENLDNPHFIIFSPMSEMKKFFSYLTHLIIINWQIFYFPCLISDSLTSLEILDLSRNRLSESVAFPKCQAPFPNVRSFIINNNFFKDLALLGNATSHMIKLVNLLASSNNIILNTEFAINWTKSLLNLNLSMNLITGDVFSFLPDNLEVLDLSFNRISSVTHIGKMKRLQVVHLSGNNILTLAEMASLSSVRVFHADRNRIQKINQHFLETFAFNELNLGNNPFVCDCNIKDAANYFGSTSATVVGWPSEYTCDSPSYLNGTEIHLISFSLATCHPGFTAVISIVVILTTVIACALIYKKNKHFGYHHISFNLTSQNDVAI